MKDKKLKEIDYYKWHSYSKGKKKKLADKYRVVITKDNSLCWGEIFDLIMIDEMI